MVDTRPDGYAEYLTRFDGAFGEKPVGAYVKFGRHLVQKLAPDDFARREARYVELRRVTKQMLLSGATMNDALTLEFEEACAWVLRKAPRLLAMFRGEVGVPEDDGDL